MKIVLTPQESEEIFHAALCNAESTGHMAGYGLQLRWHEKSYKEAKERLKERGDDACQEDILLEILRGGGHLTYFDIEGGEGSHGLSTCKMSTRRYVMHPSEPS